MKNPDKILDYSYPNGNGPLNDQHRRRAVETLHRAQHRFQSSVLPPDGGVLTHEIWERRGFSIIDTLNRISGPMFEIGGPTYACYGSDVPTWDDAFRPESYDRDLLVACSFLPNDVPALIKKMSTVTEGFGACGGTLAMAADGSALPLRSCSVSAVFARAIRSLQFDRPNQLRNQENVQLNRVLHVMLVEEAYRVLKPGGLFFYHCINLEKMCTAMTVGFQLEKCRSETTKRRWSEGDFDAVFSKQ